MVRRSILSAASTLARLTCACTCACVLFQVHGCHHLIHHGSIRFDSTQLWQRALVLALELVRIKGHNCYLRFRGKPLRGLYIPMIAQVTKNEDNPVAKGVRSKVAKRASYPLNSKSVQGFAAIHLLLLLGLPRLTCNFHGSIRTHFQQAALN